MLRKITGSLLLYITYFQIQSEVKSDQLIPKQGVLFEGQVFEAHKFVSDIVRSAEKSIILIDNYVDDTVLTLFSKRKQGVVLKILTKNLSKQLLLDTQKFNEQFPPAEIKEFFGENHKHKYIPSVSFIYD